MKTRTRRQVSLLIDFSAHSGQTVTGRRRLESLRPREAQWCPVCPGRNLPDSVLLSGLFQEVRKAAAFTPAYYLCVCQCQLLRQSPTPSPALDWHLCPPRGHTRQPYKSYVFFWRKMIFNKCNNRNFHHFFLYTKNRSFPPLQSHPRLDITSNFVLGDGD